MRGGSRGILWVLANDLHLGWYSRVCGARVPCPSRTSLDSVQFENCARTVQECNVFMPLGIALSEKQIPRCVGNVSS